MASRTGDCTFKCIPGMYHFIPRNGPEFVSATCRQIILRFHFVRYGGAWIRVGRFAWDEAVQRRLHRLSITGIYARIGLGVQLSHACTNKSDWLIRGRWIPGMQLNERSNPLRLEERISPSKQLTSTKWSKVHILSLITAFLESVERGEIPYTLFHGWCGVSYTCNQYVAGLGL